MRKNSARELLLVVALLISACAGSGSGTADTDTADTDLTVYFYRPSGEGPPLSESDLYELSVSTGEVKRLTENKRVSELVLSPDGSQLAYRSKSAQDPGLDTVYVVDRVTGTERRLGTVPQAGRVIWTPDGLALLYPSRSEGFAIGRLDIADGTTSLMTERQRGSVSPIGFVGTYLLYVESSEERKTLVRYDIEAGATVDVIEIPSVRVSLSADGSQFLVASADEEEVFRIDMGADEMALTPLLVGPWLRARPEISPDGAYLAYNAGTEVYPNQIHLTRLIDSGDPVNLTADIDTSQMGQAVWAPGSESIFFNEGNYSMGSMYYASLDGSTTSLGERGRPVLVASRVPR